jgi:hypothetical protein
MSHVVVFDLGPPHDDPERKKWERENGTGASETRTEQRDICERDPRRYVRDLPTGMTVTNRVIHC